MITLNLDLPRKIIGELNYLEKVTKKPKEFFLINYWEDLEDIRAIENHLNTHESERTYYSSEELDKFLDS